MRLINAERPRHRAKDRITASHRRNQMEKRIPRTPSRPARAMNNRAPKARAAIAAAPAKKGVARIPNRQGHDSPGSSSSADEGTAGSPEKGDGQTGDQGGDGPAADGQTGNAGQNKGKGSQMSPDSGNRPNADKKPESSEQPKSDAGNAAKSAGSSGQGSGTSGEGPPSAGGGGTQNRDDDQRVSTESPEDIPPGEKANVEYAKKTTDMVLDYLKDLPDDPKRQLLEELDWSADDLDAFVQRWQELKSAAREDPQGSGRELVESLRSLGLQPEGTQQPRRGSSGGEKTSRTERIRAVHQGPAGIR